MELPKNYEPKDAEGPIYKRWEESGFFNPDNLPASSGSPTSHQQPETSNFCIVLPPPNVTGTLHMGHAAMLAIQDILIRYHRMKGEATLWLPGTDHAAIATQSKVEKEISKKEGKSRYDLGREELLKRVNEFAAQSHDTIVNQMKRMGASLDWSREAFTLDEPRTKAVYEAFKRMYDAGLIYRGQRVINWDPKGQTTISDDEIVYEEREATLYTFKYSKDFPITIATTRPETKVGDMAVAVHPDDERYKQYVGKTFEIADFAGVPLSIKVVADAGVDKEFGTGALGVTPAHSSIDWEIAQKNNLPTDRVVINGYAKMTDAAGALLAGKKTTEARELVAQWLRDNGLMIEEKKIKQNIGTAERTGGIIEPLPKLQWFVAVNKEYATKNGAKTTLKQMMLEVVESGKIKIAPERFNAVYFNWINNLRDWCISRQIWYGHRIPVWYKGDEIFVGAAAPTGDGWAQDEDTLDTWFSSGLWTFSTLGWPNETSDLKRFHPTAVLETGYDIIFFWVARMILMSGFLLEEVPFKQVYLHGLVRDAKGQKMSKSLGNALDPLELADKYGADATRLSLIIGASAGNDQKLSEDKVRGYKNFANKIWNISRFVLMNLEGFTVPAEALAKEGSGMITNEADKAAVAEFEKAKAECTAAIESFNFHAAAEGMYHYVWHTFADKVIEEAKPRLADEKTRASAQAMLWYILTGSLKALHPFMPFVTEEIWSKLPTWSGKKMLMVESW